jgi:hypothetical protein
MRLLAKCDLTMDQCETCGEAALSLNFTLRDIRSAMAGGRVINHLRTDHAGRTDAITPIELEGGRPGGLADRPALARDSSPEGGSTPTLRRNRPAKLKEIASRDRLPSRGLHEEAVSVG